MKIKANSGMNSGQLPWKIQVSPLLNFKANSSAEN